MECQYSEIWLNASGAFCEGPTGPDTCVEYTETVDSILVPSSAEMLQDDVSFRFFEQFPSTELDRCVLCCARQHFKMAYLDDLMQHHLPSGRNPCFDWGRHYPYLKSLFQNSSLQDPCFDWGRHYPYLESLFQNSSRQVPLDIIGKLRFDTVYSP